MGGRRGRGNWKKVLRGQEGPAADPRSQAHMHMRCQHPTAPSRQDRYEREPLFSSQDLLFSAVTVWKAGVSDLLHSHVNHQHAEALNLLRETGKMGSLRLREALSQGEVPDSQAALPASQPVLPGSVWWAR